MASATVPPQGWGVPQSPAKPFKPSRLLEYFVGLEIVCQLALLSTTLAPFRVIFRTAVFGISILLMLLLPGHGRQSPAAKAAFLVMVILGLSLLNPGVNSMMSAAAEFGLSLAIIAPVFWVPRLRIDVAEVRRVLTMMWGFQFISAAFGVLQVYFPSRFQFAVSSVVLGQGAAYVAMEHFQNAYGDLVYRPMGLTDTPGGAAAAGFFAVLFGAAFFLLDRRRWRRVAAAGGMVVGMAAIYLSQVRVMLVMEIACLLTFLTLMSWRLARVSNPMTGNRIGSKRLASLTALMAMAAVGGFIWAVGVGGTAITERINTLASDNPTEVYKRNRGQFLIYTLNAVLPEYPLGAGPGRWGMMYYYFGDHGNTKSPGLYAEIQWTAWIYDGGFPLTLVYFLALMITFRTAYKISLDRRSGELAVLAALIFAYDIGILAATFDSCVFAGGGGLDFWMLNTMLSSAAYHTLRKPARSVPQAATA